MTVEYGTLRMVIVLTALHENQVSLKLAYRWKWNRQTKLNVSCKSGKIRYGSIRRKPVLTYDINVIGIGGVSELGEFNTNLEHICVTIYIAESQWLTISNILIVIVSWC